VPTQAARIAGAARQVASTVKQTMRRHVGLGLRECTGVVYAARPRPSSVRRGLSRPESNRTRTPNRRPIGG
jgi:hypothetical protein